MNAVVTRRHDKLTNQVSPTIIFETVSNTIILGEVADWIDPRRIYEAIREL